MAESTAEDMVDPMAESDGADSDAAGRSVARRGASLVAELVRLHPIPFAVAIFGAALFAGATVISTVVIGRVVDLVVLPAFDGDGSDVSAGTVGWAIAAVLAVTVLRVAGVVIRRYFAGMTSERCQRTLRRRLIDQYLGLPLSWHQRKPTGQLLAHADNDTEVTTELLHPLPFSLGVVFLAVFSAISLLVVDVPLAAVAFLIFPALTVLNQFYSRRIERPAAAVQAAVGQVSATAHESFDGALIVKTLGRADAERSRFADAAGHLRAQRITVGYIRAAFESVMDTLPNIGIVVVVVFGTYRVQAEAITQGDLVQVAALFTILALPMRVLGFFLESVPPSTVSRDRLQTVLIEPTPPPLDQPLPLPDTALSASMEGVQYSYPVPPSSSEPTTSEANGAEPATEQTHRTPVVGERVLSDVTFIIEPEEVVALVGSTGAGKSTLCSLLAGLVPPTAGRVALGDIALDRIAPAERADAVSLVFQETFLFADTVRSNIDLSGQADVAEVERAAEIAQVSGFVADLPAGFDTVVGERGVTLSGGQRQRVALARALIRRPRLLLLDDATSAVDAKVEQRILAALRTELATTSVIVAQRVSTIEIADRVLYLSNGRIVADGIHQELLNHPGYQSLVRAYEVASQ